MNLPDVTSGGPEARGLRASLLMAAIDLLVATRRLTRPTAPREEKLLPAAVWDAALACSPSTHAHLARTGDMDFLVSEAGDAFLMYRASGGSHIAMGSPIGPRSRWKELIWRFRELADRQGRRIAFYAFGADMLPFAVDLGLGIMKIGEEARVPLSGFFLEGPARAKLRQAVNRLQRAGVSFRVVQGAALAPLLPELGEVSLEWLAAKQRREKQFSLGRFDPDYLSGGPIALAERDGSILGFANLWTLPGREELSFDLMRHRIGAPGGTMDFLLTQLMLWGRDQGYRYLALGVAPLSGIENRRLAPLWARVAGTVFRHGDRFYSFSGLRRYKEKFAPEWRSLYFAAPPGLVSTTLGLIDVTLLVSATGAPRSAEAPSPLMARGGRAARRARP